MRSIEKQVSGIKKILDIWFLIALMLGTILFVFIVTTRLSHANEIEGLLNKLVEKGILTPAEAQAVLVETREEERKKIAEVKHDILPEWVQKTKVTGDFRLREAYNDTDGKDPRWRTRLRLRLGAEFKVNDQFKVGAGIASGTWTGAAGATGPEIDNQRSTNSTMEGLFSHKPITLDVAYGQYTPTNWLTVMGGKFRNPLFLIGGDDLVWDPDITPEGGAAQFNYKFCDQFGLFMNAGFFILDEFNDSVPSQHSTSGKDPSMVIVQPGFEWKIKNADYADIANLKAAVAWYEYNHVKGQHFQFASAKSGTGKTNTLDANGNFVYEYNSWQPTVQLGFMPQDFVVPYLGVFGQYVYNPDPSKDNTGWQLGGLFGAEKVQEKGQWQGRFMYRFIERDASPDFLPDDDFYSGFTNAKGWKEVFTYGIGKNTNISLTGFQTGMIRTIGTGKSSKTTLLGGLNEKVFFMDWNLAF